MRVCVGLEYALALPAPLFILHWQKSTISITSHFFAFQPSKSTELGTCRVRKYRQSAQWCINVGIKLIHCKLEASVLRSLVCTKSCDLWVWGRTVRADFAALLCTVCEKRTFSLLVTWWWTAARNFCPVLFLTSSERESIWLMEPLGRGGVWTVSIAVFDNLSYI